MTPRWMPPVNPRDVVGTGHRWLEPVSMEGVHKAVDLQAVRHTPVVSPVDGVVHDIRNEPEGLGLQVGVTDPYGFYHRVAHLETADVSPGARVGAGQHIATVGDSGAGATGPHLDYRIQDAQGNYVDPSPLLGPLAQMPRADRPGAGQAPIADDRDPVQQATNRAIRWGQQTLEQIPDRFGRMLPQPAQVFGWSQPDYPVPPVGWGEVYDMLRSQFAPRPALPPDRIPYGPYGYGPVDPGQWVGGGQDSPGETWQTPPLRETRYLVPGELRDLIQGSGALYGSGITSLDDLSASTLVQVQEALRAQGYPSLAERLGQVIAQQRDVSPLQRHFATGEGPGWRINRPSGEPSTIPGMGGWEPPPGGGLWGGLPATAAGAIGLIPQQIQEPIDAWWLEHVARPMQRAMQQIRGEGDPPLTVPSGPAYWEPRTEDVGGGQDVGVGAGIGMGAPFDLPAGGVYGMQKWLPGSTGTDIFLPRGSPITARQGGTVLLASGGTGLNQGAEMIVQFDDGTTARFRHVQPSVNGRFGPGQVLGTVNDSSMDMLNAGVAAGIGAPDGYQHLDLSINPPGTGTMFDPTGGGGGAISSAQWLQQMGYQGKVVDRTPGPQEGMMGGGMGMGMPGMPPMMGGMPGMMGGPMGMGLGGLMGPMGMGGPPMMGGMPGGMGMGSPMGGGMPSFGGLGGGGFPPLASTAPGGMPGMLGSAGMSAPAGVSGAPLPTYPPLDFSNLDALFQRPSDPFPWMKDFQKPAPLPDYQAPAWSPVQPQAPTPGTSPYFPPPWLPNSPRPGAGQDVGSGSDAPRTFGTHASGRSDVGVGATPGSAQVMIDPSQSQAFSFQAQGLQLQEQDLRARLQQITDNYSIQRAQLEQNAQQFGVTSDLDRQRLALDTQYKQAQQQLQQQLADIQTQEFTISTQLQSKQIDNNFAVAMGQLQQQWAGHEDDIRFQYAQLQLQNEWQRAQQQLGVAQMAQQGQQFNQNLALQYGQTALGAQEFGQNLAQNAAQNAQQNQLGIYQSALRSPWMQSLTGLAPAFNAPGGPAETGQWSAQGLPVGPAQSLMQPGYAGFQGGGFGGQTTPYQSPTGLSAAFGGQGASYQSPTGLTATFGGHPAMTPQDPTQYAGTGQDVGSGADPVMIGNLQHVGPLDRPSGPPGGQIYTLPNGKTFTTFDVWNYEQANPGIDPNAAYQHFMNDLGLPDAMGSSFPQGSTVAWMGSGDTGSPLALPSPGQTTGSTTPSITPPSSLLAPTAPTPGTSPFSGLDWLQSSQIPMSGLFPTDFQANTIQSPWDAGSPWSGFISSLQANNPATIPTFSTGIRWPAGGPSGTIGGASGTNNLGMGQDVGVGEAPVGGPLIPVGADQTAQQMRDFMQMGVKNNAWWNTAMIGLVQLKDRLMNEGRYDLIPAYNDFIDQIAQYQNEWWADPRVQLPGKMDTPAATAPPVTAPFGGNPPMATPPPQETAPVGANPPMAAQPTFDTGLGTTPSGAPDWRNASGGWQPADLFQPPPTPQVPTSWSQLQYQTPFQWAALRNNVEMSGTPWESWQNQARSSIADSGGPLSTPNLTRLSGQNILGDQQSTLGQNMTADFFGEGPSNYWNRQQSNWSPSFGGGASFVF